MSEVIWVCPVPTTIPAIALPDCPANYGNVCGIAFQIKQASPSFDAEDIVDLATWTPLIASATATGIRTVPVANYETTPGEAITRGGNDQTTVLGREVLKYGGFTRHTFMLEDVTAEYASKVRGLSKYTAASRPVLRAFLFTDANYVTCGLDFQGFPIHSLFVGDVKKGGDFKIGDNYAAQFNTDYGWSGKTQTIQVEFDVLTLFGLQ